MPLQPLYLKKNADRRLRAGHLWIYSNEVDIQKSPLRSFEAGQPVTVFGHDQKPLGSAYVNSASLICARIISRDPDLMLDQSLLVHRINVALSLRQRLFSQPCYRLIYGESDGLPGLVVDRYEQVLVVQLGTAGMERLKNEIIAALEKVLKPAAIVLRNDSSTRAMENLNSYVEVASGTLPAEPLLIENSTRFRVPILEGQKTGWFYDHRLNRARLQSYVRGLRVLDLFSYVGGWGVQAAVAGAQDVLCVDSSQQALDQIPINAGLNGVADRVRTLHADVFEALKDLRQEQERFDVIILDPPAFIKRRKDQQAGESAYRRINQLAMTLLKRDGILVSASCSLHLPAETLLDLIRATGRHVDRHVQLLEQGHQGADHPIHPAIPETAYLKAFFCRVLPAL